MLRLIFGFFKWIVYGISFITAGHVIHYQGITLSDQVKEFIETKDRKKLAQEKIEKTQKILQKLAKNQLKAFDDISDGDKEKLIRLILDSIE